MAECLNIGIKSLGKDGKVNNNILSADEYNLVESVDEIEARLAAMSEQDFPVAFDYETNSLDVNLDKFHLVSVAFAAADGHWCMPLEHPQALWSKDQIERIYGALRKWLVSDCPKIVQNLQYEELVSRSYLHVPVNNAICCTMVREHILDNRTKVCSQEFQIYCRYGFTYKNMVNITDMDHEFLDTILRYNTLDARYLFKWYLDQTKEMEGRPDLQRAYDFFP